MQRAKTHVSSPHTKRSTVLRLRAALVVGCSRLRDRLELYSRVGRQVTAELTRLATMNARVVPPEICVSASVFFRAEGKHCDRSLFTVAVSKSKILDRRFVRTVRTRSDQSPSTNLGRGHRLVCSTTVDTLTNHADPPSLTQ